MLKITSGNVADMPHGFFGVSGGVSTDDYASLNCGLAQGDSPENVAENRQRVMAALAAPAADLQTMSQVHETDVAVIREIAEKPPKADALVTTSKGIALGVLTADCVPVLLADARNGVIAAVHAGWPSAFDGIVTKTIEVMRESGADLLQVRAAIGPCIRQDSYEIDRGYYERFLRQSPENEVFFRPVPEKAGHFLFDLAGYVRRQTEAAGVREIADCGEDTCAQPEKFFSYRRHMLSRGHGRCGRQISVIALG